MSSDAVLITGGAGFIGRALVAECLRAHNRVVVFDNLCTGQLENLAPFLDSIEFIRADILDRTALAEAMAKCRPTMIFHLAAHHFIPYCDAHPGETLRVNVEGTHAVLSEAARHDVRVAVVASSGSIYPSYDGLIGEDLPPAPVDIYGLSKHLTEKVSEFVANTTTMRCVSARLFNVYGPFETNPHLIPHIIESLRQGPAIQLGNIHTKRDYIHVEDVASALYQSGRKAISSYTVVNVGTGKEYSAQEIVQTISEILGYDITINVVASRVRNVDKMHQRANAQKLEGLIGTWAQNSLREGLQKLLADERIRKS